jgi:hypothetical protein
MDDERLNEIIEEMWYEGSFRAERTDAHMSYQNFDVDLDGLCVLLVLPKLHGWRVSDSRTSGFMSHQLSVEDVAEAFEERSQPREMAIVSLDYGTWEPIWVCDGQESNADRRGWDRA